MVIAKRRPRQEEPEEGPQIYRVVPEAPKIRALVYGESGVGKTTLAATAQDHPRLGPVLFADIDGGLLSVAHRKDIHAVDIKSTSQLEELYIALKRKEGLFGEIGTLIVDNITQLQTLNLDEIVQEEMVRNKSGNRESSDEIWQEDYGKSTVQLNRLYWWLANLDINIILIAHAKYVYPPSGNKRQQNPDAEPIAVLPMLTQKHMKTVMGLMDFCWYLHFDPESGARNMLTQPDGIYQAKTRGPRFAKSIGPVVENPTFPVLYDKLIKAESGGKNGNRTS